MSTDSTDFTPSFAQLGLAAPILQAIQSVGYEAPSPIQAESIPPLLAGHDLVGQAQTGTGKTAAFALPLLSRLNLDIRQPQLLVLTPTRELALQVAEAFQKYAHYLPGFHVLPVYGGQGMTLQLRQLKRGVHVVVGTPGRIMDHLRRKSLVLDSLQAVVLDEADDMLRMGFIEDVEWILEHTPPERQVALFSATMPPPIRKIAQRHLRQPVEIKIHTKTTTVSTISQYYWQVTNTHKIDALTRILEAEDFEAMLVFVRTKTITLELAEKLEARGYACAALNGDMPQAQREKTIERLKSGDLDIIVATDVVARGLDVERISHVLNYDIPHDTEAYVHRIGRTGRAGRKGTAILFVSPREKRLLRAIEQATRQPIALMRLPSHEDIADRRVARFKQQLSDTIESQELGFFEEMLEQYQSEHNIAMNEIAAALAYQLQRERPLLPGDNDDIETASFTEEAEQPSRRQRERDRADTRQRRGGEAETGMLRYRLEVGREHGVQPKNIVGAIANEGGLSSRHIGRIELYDSYSTVELPEGMPDDICKHLQNVWVCNRKINMHLESGSSEHQEEQRPAFSPRRSTTRKPLPSPTADDGRKAKKRTSSRRKRD